MKTRAFNPRNLLLVITSGLVVAAIYIPVTISLAALFFSGGSAADLVQGIGLLLAGALLFSAIVSLTTSFQLRISVPQHTPAVLLALLSATIFSNLPSSSADGFASYRA